MVPSSNLHNIGRDNLLCSDSNYATCPDTRRSVSGWTVFLGGAVVSKKSKKQQCVTTSISEAELVAVVECILDMIHFMHILESLGLQIQKPMILVAIGLIRTVLQVIFVTLMSRYTICMNLKKKGS